MKRFIFCGILFSLLLPVAVGQGKQLVGQASKALNKYKLDQNNNISALSEAVDAIEQAMQYPEANTAEGWQMRGEIYNSISTKIVTIKQLGFGSLDELPAVDNPAIEAYNSFSKALELAEKMYETKDALRGLAACQSNLNHLGFYAYGDKTYALSYGNFQRMLEAHDVLSRSGKESALDDPTAYIEQVYITGLAALNAQQNQEARRLFMELYNKNYEKPAIYEALYKLNGGSSQDASEVEAAYSYLKKGRQLFPDEVSLLFAEINHYLKLGKSDQLIGKLQQAIAREPQNISLYASLGNVYDNLYQQAAEAENESLADEYYQQAMKSYQDALSRDASFFDAIYSIGALIYNKAAQETKKLNALEDDMSQEGMTRYEEQKKVVFDLFDEALPHFKKAESLNPNDINTLIALQEIFARKDDLATSMEMKRRLDTVQGGGSNDYSYFNE